MKDKYRYISYDFQTKHMTQERGEKGHKNLIVLIVLWKNQAYLSHSKRTVCRFQIMTRRVKILKLEVGEK